MSQKEDKDIKEPANNFNHLKWPAIIITALIVIIVIAFDYCSRVGDI